MGLPGQRGVGNRMFTRMMDEVGKILRSVDNCLSPLLYKMPLIGKIL